mgnify:CR=1 FL=1
MYKVLVFAGTTEGYEICRFLADHKIETKGFVATEYGSKSLTENEFLTVQTGRLDAADMEEVFLQEKPEMVLDATHPYAAEVTVNIRTACEKYADSILQGAERGVGNMRTGQYMWTVFRLLQIIWIRPREMYC